MSNVVFDYLSDVEKFEILLGITKNVAKKYEQGKYEYDKFHNGDYFVDRQDFYLNLAEELSNKKMKFIEDPYEYTGKNFWAVVSYFQICRYYQQDDSIDVESIHRIVAHKKINARKKFIFLS